MKRNGSEVSASDLKGRVGPNMTKHTILRVEAGNAEVTNLDLRFGAADFKLVSEDRTDLLYGDVYHSNLKLAPTAYTEPDGIFISQDAAGLFNFQSWKTRWDLTVSNRYKMRLKIKAGAFDGQLDCGGLRLKELTMKTGAARVETRFSAPNPEAMGKMHLITAASSFSMTNLMNAGFRNMIFEGGAGDYKFDFSGAIPADPTYKANAFFRMGFSAVEFRIPKNLPAQINLRNIFAPIDAPAFTRTQRDLYRNNAAYRNNNPILNIEIQMGMGNITVV